MPLTTPIFQILLSLIDNDAHGYALIQDIRKRTDGEVSLTASTLYAAVKRLVDSKWIEELAESPRGEGDDPRRRYYSITATGRTAARLEAERLERATSMARDRRLLAPLHAAPAGKGPS
ncbi:MAG: PadR family transcriptional regulator [Gemmatimonadaceae bacterium]